MNKDKKSISRIILHICEYILLAFIIFLIVMVVLKACEKDVNALDNKNEQEILVSDLTNVDYYAYSTPFDNNLVINDESILIQVYLYDSNDNLKETLQLTVRKWGNNSFSLTMYGSGVKSIYNYQTFSGSFEYNAVCFSAIKFENQYYNFNFDYLGYTDDNQKESRQMGTFAYSDDSSIYKARYVGDLRFWYKSVIPQHEEDYNAYYQNLFLYLTTNKYYQDQQYKEEHLFGNLVASFLNIQFGRVSIGNTTYDLSLGLLLLFILGLGALFVIVKVFLGG